MLDLSQTKPQLRWQLTFEGAWPMTAAFIDGGKRLAAGNQAGRILIWDLATADAAGENKPADKPAGDKAPSLAPTRMLVGHTNGVSRLLATPDGQTLFSASLDHTIRAWDLTAAATGEEEIVVDQESRDQAAKRSGKKEAAPAPGIKVATQQAAAVLEGHRQWVSMLAMSRDGNRLISGDFGAQVIVWDVKARKETARWTGQPWNWIVGGALSSDGSLALVSEYRHKRDDFDVPAAAVRVWNVAEQKVALDVLKVQFPKYDLSGTSYGSSQTWRKWVGAGLVAADISPDGKLLALGQGGETDSGVIHVLDAATGKQLRDVSSHLNGVTDARFSDDGEYLFTTGRDTTLRICRVSDGKEVQQLHKPRGGQFKDWLSSVAISPDQKWIAATDIAGLVHVWALG